MNKCLAVEAVTVQVYIYLYMLQKIRQSHKTGRVVLYCSPQ